MAGSKTFEEKFGQLVENQLSENLPSLFEYRSGFQLIDKTDDDTKAVGITVFVVNGLWLYLMSFFIDGDIKGMDVLYNKDSDTFVPARDNWVALFKENGDRAIVLLKDHSDVNTKTMGSTTIDDDSLYKNANELVSEREWLDMLLERGSDDGYSLSLPDQLNAMGKEAQEIFTNTLLNSPDFANSVFQFYKPSELSKIAEDMLQEKPKVPVKKESVSFISSIESPDASKLKDSEKKLLMRNGVYIEDNRINVSKVFYNVIDTNTIQNPTQSGVFDVMMRTGEYKPCALFLFNDPSVSPDHKITGAKVALVDLAKPNVYLRADRKDVFCKPVKDPVKLSKKVSSTLGLMATARTFRDIKTYTKILIVNGLDDTLQGSLSGVMAGKRYFTPIVPNEKRIVGGFVNTISRKPKQDLAVDFTNTDGKITTTANKVYIPLNARVFKNGADYELKLGRPGIIREILHKQADYNPLMLHVDRNNYQVTYKGETKQYMNKVAILKDLVLDKGIYAGQAQGMLKDASITKGKRSSYLIKEAFSLDSFGNKSNATSHKDENTPTVQYNKANGDKAVKALPQDAVRVATNASKNGIKDVFDVSVIKTILSNMSVSELRKNYIKDMVKGMDRTGRLLLLFYWHNDQFKERYGLKDIDELESTIKDVFLKMGDLVLFLKEKSVYNPNISENLLGTLSEDIGSSQGA